MWFIAVQAVALDAWCPYCLLIHACGLIAAVLVLTLRRGAASAAPARLQPFGAPNVAPRVTTQLPPPAIGAPTLFGVLSVAALVLGQVFFPTNLVRTISAAAIQGEFNLDAVEATPTEPVVPEPTDAVAEQPAEESPSSSRPAKRAAGKRMVTLLEGKIKIDVYEHPVLGNPEAEQVIIEFFDYGCPHCRKLHELMTEARERYGDQVAVVTFPWPLEARCNKMVFRTKPKSRGSCRVAELALAVFQANGNAFPAMHDFLMTGENLPQYTAARLTAEELVGQNELDAALRSQKPAGRLKQYVDLLAALSQGRQLGLPTQIVGKTVFSGPLNTVDDVAKIWEENLGIKPASP